MIVGSVNVLNEFVDLDWKKVDMSDHEADGHEVEKAARGHHEMGRDWGLDDPYHSIPRD